MDLVQKGSIFVRQSFDVCKRLSAEKKKWQNCAGAWNLTGQSL